MSLKFQTIEVSNFGWMMKSPLMTGLDLIWEGSRKASWSTRIECTKIVAAAERNRIDALSPA